MLFRSPMSPIARGVGLAVAAALAFGVTSPLVQALGRGIGPFTTAALLYAGAAVFSALAGARPPREQPFRFLAVAFAGAFVAPVLLAAGLALVINAVMVSLGEGRYAALVAATIVVIVALDLALIIALSAPFRGGFVVSRAPLESLRIELQQGRYLPWIRG